MGRKISTKDFIANSRKVHGDKYDYSKVEYVKNNLKVCIICPDHGEFYQQPANHLQGKGCNSCGITTRSNKRFSRQEDVIERFNKEHNFKYDYSKVIYKGLYEKVIISCPEHGEFLQKPDSHLKGSGCQKCGKIKERLNYSNKILNDKFKGLVQPKDYKLIPLTQGKFSKVDNEDFDKVKDINWRYNKGYASHSKVGLMHRLIMNPPEELDVDHIYGDTLDNRRCNLRSGETYQNLANIRKSTGRSSKYKGVTWNKLYTVWESSIRFKGKKFYLGSFDVEEEAAKAYDKKAIELRGEWAYQTLNFPELKEEYLKQIKIL